MAVALRKHPVASALFDPRAGRTAGTVPVLRGPADRDHAPVAARLAAANHHRPGHHRRLQDRRLIQPGRHRARPSPGSATTSRTPGTRTPFGRSSPACDVRFVFVFQEKTPPYIVTVAELDAEAAAVGDDLNREAIAKYVECTETGSGPATCPTPRSARSPSQRGLARAGNPSHPTRRRTALMSSPNLPAPHQRERHHDPGRAAGDARRPGHRRRAVPRRRRGRSSDRRRDAAPPQHRPSP